MNRLLELAHTPPRSSSISPFTQIFLPLISTTHALHSTTHGVAIGALKSTVMVAVAGGIGSGRGLCAAAPLMWSSIKELKPPWALPALPSRPSPTDRSRHSSTPRIESGSIHGRRKERLARIPRSVQSVYSNMLFEIVFVLEFVGSWSF